MLLRSLLALLVATSTVAAGAGTLMVTKTTTQGRTIVTEIRAQGGNLRMDSPAERSSVIVTGNTVYAINHGDRSYMVLDQATMRRLGGQLAAVRQQMQAQLAQLPPEQRAAAERMMAGMGAGGAPARASRTTYRATNRNERAAGIACKVWEGYEGNSKTDEVCVAAPSTLPGGNELLAAMAQVGKTVSGFGTAMGVDFAAATQQGWDQLEQLRGVPIVVRDIDKGRVVSTMVVDAIRAENVPAARFAIPNGYRQQSMGGAATGTSRSR